MIFFLDPFRSIDNFVVLFSDKEDLHVIHLIVLVESEIKTF